MELSDLHKQLVERHGIRVKPHMEAYVLERMKQRDPIRVIGGDARTGVPIVKTIDPKSLTEPS